MKHITLKVLTAFILTVLLVLSLSSCAEKDDNGISYESNKDGTCSVNGFDNDEITAVTIPAKSPSGDTVVAIGANAFTSAQNIITVILPDTLKAIGAYSFYNCTALTEINIPESVTKIEASAFSGCTALKKVIINGSALEEIGNYTFKGCNALTSFSIPAGVKTLGDYVFLDCTGLDAIDVTDGNTSFKSVDGVLYDAETVKLIRYPSSKTGAAYTIADTVTTIANGAFWGASTLETIDIPNTVQVIGDYAFRDCIALKDKLYLSDALNSLGTNAFYGCKALKTIIIKEGITEIKGWCFRDCTNLVSLVIPKSVTNIGTSAFSGCDSLVTVYYGGTTSEDWGKITIAKENGPFSSDPDKTVKSYYSATKPESEGGRNWHYEGGLLTEW